MSREEPFREPLIRLADNVRRALAREMETRLHAAGFDDHRPAFNNIFGYLWEPDGTRITTLAERALVTKQSMSELVRQAVDLGYAELVPDPADGRAKLVRFGPRGRAAAKVVRKVFADLEKELVARYGPRRMRELRDLLTRIAENPPQGARRR